MIIPSTLEIYNAIVSDVETELGVSISTLKKTFLRARIAVQAVRIRLIYLSLAKVQKNVFVDTADPEAQGGTLERIGRVKLGRSPLSATPGSYIVQFSGDVGSIVPLSQTFKSDDSSLNPANLYIIDGAFTLGSTPATQQSTLRSLTLGSEARLSIGDTLTVTSPLSLVDSVVTVVSETIVPISAETVEEYRQKIIESFRLEAQGGAGADYRLWSSGVNGLATVYPFAASSSPTFINLYIEATIEDSDDGKGTAGAAIIDDAQSQIEDPSSGSTSKKPLTANVNYLSVSPLDVDITIDSFIGITPSIEALIFAETSIQLQNTRPFVGSIDVLSERNDVFDVNKIISIILSVAPGSSFGTVTLTVDGTPLVSKTFENGDIPFLNSISYI